MALTLTGYVFDNSGNAIPEATVQGYVSADNASTTAGDSVTTDANGKWTITTSTATQIPMDVKITYGSNVRWIKAGDKLNITDMTVTGTLTVGEDAAGFDFALYSADSAGDGLTWDASEEVLQITGKDGLTSLDVLDGDVRIVDKLYFYDRGGEYISSDGSTLTITGTTAFASATTLATGTTVGNLTLANGSITDSSGTISFGDEALVTTGVITAGGFTIGAAVVDAAELEILDGASVTTAELNIMDGGATVGTTAVSDGHGIVMNHGGTMAQTTVQTLAAYLDDEITAMPNLVTTAATTVGVLANGSIDTGFGTINNNAAITGTTVTGSTAIVGGTVAGTTGTFSGVVDITDTTDASDATGDTGALRTEGGASIAQKLYVGTDLDVDGTANLDNTDIDGTLVVDGSNISLDSTTTLNIDNSNTSNGISIGTATASVPINIGHGTSLVTIGDNLTVTGDLTVSGTTTTVTSTTVAIADSLLLLAKDQGTSADAVDFGFYGKYGVGGTAKYAGIFRDGSATGDPWTFFDGNQAEPGTTVNVGGTGYDLADISAGGITAADGFTGDLTGDVTGNADTVTTNANLTGHVISSGNAATLGSFTSAHLLGALTNETGTGVAVFNTSPTLVTPALGTPASGVMTNMTGAVTASIVDDAITSAKIADDAITNALMAANSVDSDQYVNGSIDTAHYAAGSVDATALGADSVTAAKIGDNVLNSEHYAAGSIDNEHLADDAVDSDEIAAGAIDTAHIADNQVTLAKMAGIARGKIIYGDASGDPAVLASGSANQVLTMTDGDDFDWADSTVGDITSVVAGAGMTGGATTGDATLNVIGGDGIAVAADAVAVDLVSNGGLEIAGGELQVATGIAQHDIAQYAASVADNDFLRIDGTKVEGLSAAEVAAAIEGSIDAVGTIASGVWNGTAIAAAYMAQGTTTAKGALEIATTAEINTSTDAARAMTPDLYAASNYGIRYVQVLAVAPTTNLTVADGLAYFYVPAGLDGMDLVEVHAEVITAPVGSTATFEISINGASTQMLSTNITIDAGEFGSDTAATAPVINTSNDDLDTHDVVQINCTQIGSGTAGAGLIVTMGFRIP